MNHEQVKAIMDAMSSGMTQREAEEKLGISAKTIGRVARANGFVVDKTEQLRKGALKYHSKQRDLFGENEVKQPTRVTTSHYNLSTPDKWSGSEFILDAF